MDFIFSVIKIAACAMVLVIGAALIAGYFYDREMRKPDICYSPYSELINRLRMRAHIRRQIPSRKSVQEGKSDRLADLLDEAADTIERLSR